LVWRQVIDTYRRHLGHAELAAGEQPAMPGDQVEIDIDQHRTKEAKGRDAVGDLPDLFLPVDPWIRGG
jgi:hypothetical protein